MLLACASCAQKNTVSACLEGIEGDSVKVQVFDVNSSRTAIQSFMVPVQEGKFVFDLADSVVRSVTISNPSDEKGFNAARIFVVPGENAVLKGKLDSLVVSGSKFYKDQTAYEKLCEADQARMKEIVNEYNAAADSENVDAVRDSLMNIYNEVNEDLVGITKDFVKNNPASLYAATLLSRIVGDNGIPALEAIEAMPDAVKNGAMKPLVDQVQTRAEKAKARSEAAELVKDGMQAPDFTLKNEKGEDFTLSSIYNQGKYIILDFWGEWCYWCKKGIPDMKQMYKDAKGKIEILSIDCGDKEDVWKNAIVEHELPWLHVYNPGEKNNDLAVTYAIQGYPTKIILNPDGTINKTIIGEDPEFYEYVKSLIK